MMIIATAAAVEALVPGQWVFDANGSPLCLVDTNVGFPQRMWMSQGGRGFTAIDQVMYPLTLADLDEECPHSVGAQECGHCRRCGQVIESPKDLHWNISVLQIPPDDLDWHYGPTDADSDPGKMWCRTCAAEVYGFEEGYICTGCNRASRSTSD